VATSLVRLGLLPIRVPGASVRGLVGGKRADDGGPEHERLKPNVRERSGGELRGDVDATSRGCLVPFPRRSRLRRDRDLPAGAERAPKLCEPLHRLIPEAGHVDARILSNRSPNVRSASAEASLRSTRRLRTALALRPRALVQHHLGVIDAAYQALGRHLAEVPDRHARAEADLEHAIATSHIEQRHHPRVPAAIRRA